MRTTLTNHKIVLTLPALFILLLMIGGCGHRVDNSQLTFADTLLVQNQTEEALQILELLNTTSFSHNDKAYHALLITQARHARHITATEDSTINQAVKFYKTHNDKEKYARALLY